MDDHKEIFDAVAAFVQEKGYGVIVNQVREELATGRLTEEKIGTLKESRVRPTSLLEANDFKRGQAAEFVRRRDYSNAEALVLLLEAAKRAIVDTAVMVADINALLAEFDIDGVVLAGEDQDASSGINLNCQVERSRAEEYARRLNQIIEKIERP